MKENRLYLFSATALIAGIIIGVLFGQIIIPASGTAKAKASATAANTESTPQRTSILHEGTTGSEGSDAFRTDEATGESQGIEALALSLADKESDEILSALEKIQGTAAREHFIRTIFTKIASDEPQFAMELAKALPDTAEKMTALKSVALELAFQPQNFKTDDQMGYDAAMIGATAALSSTNPEAATLWASTQLEGRSRSIAMMGAASRWASADPNAALAWAAEHKEELGDGRGGDWMLRSMVSQAAQTDPAASASYLQTMENGRSRSAAIGTIAGSWYDKDPSAAMKWMSSLPNAEDQSQAANTIASRLANNKSPQDALQWANTLTNEQTRNAAVTSAVSTWARTDAQAAANYATTLSGDAQSSAVRTVASNWARQDAAAATAWAQQITNPELQQSALSSIERAQRGNQGGGGWMRGGARGQGIRR